jgi:hypothetical protein
VPDINKRKGSLEQWIPIEASTMSDDYYVSSKELVGR